MFLDMGSLTAANATALPWTLAQQPDLSNDGTGTSPGANTAGYLPTMALAQNHIYFEGVPGAAAGDVVIFVIHCMFPTPRRFLSNPLNFLFLFFFFF